MHLAWPPATRRTYLHRTASTPRPRSDVYPHALPSAARAPAPASPGRRGGDRRARDGRYGYFPSTAPRLVHPCHNSAHPRLPVSTRTLLPVQPPRRRPLLLSSPFSSRSL